MSPERLTGIAAAFVASTAAASLLASCSGEGYQFSPPRGGAVERAYGTLAVPHAVGTVAAAATAEVDIYRDTIVYVYPDGRVAKRVDTNVDFQSGAVLTGPGSINPANLQVVVGGAASVGGGNYRCGTGEVLFSNGTRSDASPETLPPISQKAGAENVGLLAPQHPADPHRTFETQANLDYVKPGLPVFALAYGKPTPSGIRHTPQSPNPKDRAPVIIPGQVVSVDPITQRVAFLVGFSDNPDESTLTTAGDYGAALVDSRGGYLGNVTDFWSDDKGDARKFTGKQLEELFGFKLPSSYQSRTFAIATAKLVTTGDLINLQGAYPGSCHSKNPTKRITIPVGTNLTTLPREKDL